jgi:hypothetical protein
MVPTTLGADGAVLSSLVMVPTAAPAVELMVAPAALLRVTVKVSFASAAVSPETLIVMVLETSLALK